MKIKYIYIAMALGMLAACSQNEELVAADDSADIIHVGGVSTEAMTLREVQTRAGEGTDSKSAENVAQAENVDWLASVLKGQGMDITYLTKTAQQKARLKLETDVEGNLSTSEGGVTIYSLTAYDSEGNLTATPAKWLGNGVHTFQGVYVPEGLKQGGAHSYEDLSHYTAVPPMADISATVGRITIPLQHRLARVVAYVLIEPSMNAKLKGYISGAKSSAENTMLRFCNVQTLGSVNAQGQPVWKTERKAIPNYLGEEKVTYEGKEYGLCPRYDLIVRPTYTKRTSGSNVMYDEQAGTTDEGTNSIDFELTLDNDLEYEKHFVFDLNANDETVVYLRVSPERIDYNSAGSRLWKETSYADKEYPLDVDGYNLSTMGSSWQRAYTTADANWMDKFKEAYEGGKHHGDYFILSNDITIDTDKLPENFVFTGHLDGMDHTITLTGKRGYLFDGLNGEYTTAQEKGKDAPWEANVHKEGNTWVPIPGYRAEVVNTKIKAGSLFKTGAIVTGYVNNCKDQLEQ